MFLRRILVGTDFSESSDTAVEAAFEAAKQLGSSLTLVHTYQPAPLGYPDEGTASPHVARVT